MIQNGLKPITKISTKWYPTDRSFIRTFGGIKPIEFPKEFSIDSGLTMPDQISDKLPLGCTAYTQNELCTDQDLIIYDDYEYTYRKTLEMEGVFQLNIQGCDIRDSMKIICTIGPKTKKEGDVDGEAKARGAYYVVESKDFDWFDSFRSVILTNFQNNKIKCAVSIGTPWFKEWDITGVGSSGIIPQIFTGNPMSLSWHNWAIKGWKEINGIPYLLAKTWQGKHYGDGGWSYYSRETINAVMKIKYTGAYTVAPRNASNVQTVKLNLLETLLRFCQTTLELLFKKKISNPINTMPEPTLTPIQEVPKYDFSYPKAARHSTRVICDEEGLNLARKNTICATIMGESEFYNYINGEPLKRLNFKKDGVTLSSTDWGICQINDTPGWHIGKGLYFESVQDVLSHPEKAIRYMIKMEKAGKLNLWIAYKSGAYKKYL